MKLHVLGSSSSGNCYLFQSEKTGEVLAVEAGVKFNKVKKVLDFNLNSIVGCIVSHEHGDHAKCVGDFINAFIPCYMSQGTKHALGFSSSYWAKGLLPFEQVVINGFRVIPFPVQHDAAEPYGYLIRHEECGTVLFATDTYFLKYKFPGLNNVMLECNYSKEILDANFTAGRIDKKRYERTIKSHMSYDNCLLTLQANDLSQVCNILLLHLSDNNSNATEFIHGIERLYPEIEITAATNGLSLTFNKNPY
jgi:phosphoribosyl 1,2-cyclic phosphodiesterase